MNPWVERHTLVQHKGESSGTRTPFSELLHMPLCPNYPSCVKEERKCLQEIRAQGPSIPDNYVLSNGLVATDFALYFVMKHHLKRKGKSTTRTQTEIKS